MRIVAEPLAPPRRRHDTPGSLTPPRPLHAAARQRRHADITPPAIGHSRERLEQRLVVRRFERRSLQVASATPPLAVHPRPPAQRIDSQAAVVGDRRQPASPMVVSRLGQRVLLERLEYLDLVLVRRQRQARLVKPHHMHPCASEHRAELAEFAGAPRTEQERSS